MQEDRRLFRQARPASSFRREKPDETCRNRNTPGGPGGGPGGSRSCRAWSTPFPTTATGTRTPLSRSTFATQALVTVMRSRLALNSAAWDAGRPLSSHAKLASTRMAPRMSETCGGYWFRRQAAGGSPAADARSAITARSGFASRNAASGVNGPGPSRDTSAASAPDPARTLGRARASSRLTTARL